MVDESMRVGVLMGGMSSERPVSLQSGAAVLEALTQRGWDAVGIDVGPDLPARLVDEGVDVAWLALHGKFGEDGCVQGLLEIMQIPYTGSGVRASAVAMDKAATKRAVAGLDSVVLAADTVLREGEPVGDVPLPAVVKPLVGGSTLGMALVRTRDELLAGLRAAWKLHPEVMVEQYIAGDEITVAVLDGEPLPVVRIVPESGFFDFEAKYTKGKTRYEVPAAISDQAKRRASDAAVAAYEAVGCRGLCRADFMVGDDDVPVFLEINTIPGMTATSLSPMAAAQTGVDFESLVERILRGARVMAPEV